MGRDEKLGVLFHQRVHQRQQAHLTGGRERRFRFVEQVQAMAAKAIEHQREKAFAVGLLMQGFAAVRGTERWQPYRFLIQPVNFAGYVVEAFSTEKKTVLWPLIAADELEAAVQVRMRGLGGKLKILRAALRIEAASDSNGLQQGGFSGAVFTDKKGHRTVKGEGLQIADGGDGVDVVVRGFGCRAACEAAEVKFIKHRGLLSG